MDRSPAAESSLPRVSTTPQPAHLVNFSPPSPWPSTPEAPGGPAPQEWALRPVEVGGACRASPRPPLGQSHTAAPARGARHGCRPLEVVHKNPAQEALHGLSPGLGGRRSKCSHTTITRTGPSAIARRWMMVTSSPRAPRVAAARCLRRHGRAVRLRGCRRCGLGHSQNT